MESQKHKKPQHKKAPFKKQNSDKNSLQNSAESNSEEADLLEKISGIRDDLATSAQSIVHFDFPRKIVQLNTFLKEPATPFSEIADESISSTSALHSFSSQKDLFLPSTSQTTTPHTGSDSKKRKLEESTAAPSKKPATETSTDSSSQPETENVQIHKTNTKLMGELKKEVIEMIELVSRVKLWIQLNIPRIEDGNNFGVRIQEETVAELSRIEDTVLGILESFPSYFLTRAKLVTRIHKYPFVSDYVYAIKELDEKQFFTTRLYFTELRNGYALLHDLITKNLEKITKPRASNHMEALF